MVMVPTTTEALEEFINRVTQDATAKLVNNLGETLKAEIPGMIQEYASSRLDEMKAIAETAVQAASEQAAEAVKVTSAQRLEEVEANYTRAVEELKEAAKQSAEQVESLESQHAELVSAMGELQDKIRHGAMPQDIDSRLEELFNRMHEHNVGYVSEFVGEEVKKASGIAQTQVRSDFQTTEAKISRQIKELALDTHSMVGELRAQVEGSGPRSAEPASAPRGTGPTSQSEELPRAHEFNIGSPHASGHETQPDGVRRHAGREIRIMKPTYDKLGLKVLKDESNFKSWSKSLDMAFDDIWVGIEVILKSIKTRKERVTAEEFKTAIVEADLRSSDMREEDWSFKIISRYLYGVLFNHTEETLQGIVEQCEEEKDGIEAYRLLSTHCDPVTYNTSNALMESITKLGRRKVNSNPMMAVDEFLTTVREVRKAVTEYEKRVARLHDAKTTWIPSMMIELMNGEMLTFVRQQNASGDLDKMESAIKELRQINRSVGAKSNLRQMNERSTESDEGDAAAAEDEENFNEWAASPDTSKDQILAAIGKGSGKGNRPRFVPRRNGAQPKTPAAEWKPRPPAAITDGSRQVETRRCYNCDKQGHLGKDCPMPDRRLDKDRVKKVTGGSAKTLAQAPDSEGFLTVSAGIRPKLCMMRSPVGRATNAFAALRSEDKSDNELECPESVNRSMATNLSDDTSFPMIMPEKVSRARKRMKKIGKTQTQRERRSNVSLKQSALQAVEKTKKDVDPVEIPPPPKSVRSRIPRRRNVVRFADRSRLNVCRDEECECEDEPQGASQNEIPAGHFFDGPISSEDESDDDGEGAPMLADSDDEEDILDVSDSRLSPKQLERRETRKEREKHARIRREQLERDRPAAAARNTDPNGSSADLPLTADDARHDRLYTHETPRVGQGETHQSAESDTDLLSPDSDGYISMDALFGTGMSRFASTKGQVSLMYERRGVLNAVNPGWERLTLTVDSGASDTVVPRTVCSLAPLVKGPRYGIEYEIANGETIDNEGERDCLMRVGEADASEDNSMQVTFQVVDVTKALLSVHRVCEQGHDVMFSKKDGGSAILVNGDPNNRIPLRNCGGTYELDVWVRPNPGFSRPR